MEVQIFHKEVALFGAVRPIEKHCESILRCTQQKINTVSARLLQTTALLSTGRCHINFSLRKIRSPAIRPLVKIL